MASSSPSMIGASRSAASGGTSRSSSPSICDGKGFIRTLQVLDAAPSASSSTRDRTITRLSVLKTAAAFLAQMGQVHEGVKSDHVIPLADRWLAWVEQEGGDATD